jgi:hypothetical protein
MRRRAVALLTVAAATALARAPAAAAGGSWQSIGPSGGSVRGLAIDPSSTHTLYALAGGGLFKTLDGGHSWFHSDAGLLPGPVVAVSIDPRSPSRIYAAVVGFVFRSGDGGFTWTQAGRPGAGFPLTSLAIDPRSPQTLYAGSSFGILMYKSIDEGASWVASDSGLGALPLTLAIDPHQPATIYAGTATGIWKSVDSGASWQAASKGMGTPAPAVLAITVDPVRRGTVYAGVQSVTQSEPGGLYVSRNGGATWKLLLAQPNPAGVSCLVISPAARRPLYACSAGLFKSSDGGRSWQQLDGGLGAAAIGFLVLDPASPDRLYAGISDVLNPGPAVFATTSSGGSWQAAGAGISATATTALAADPVQQGTLLWGTANAGLFKTTDDGAHWMPDDLGLRGNDVRALAIDPQSPATLYAETNRAFFATHDSGARWLRPGARFAGGPPLVVDPQTPTTLYSVSGSSLYRSLDGGFSWEQTYSWADSHPVPLPAALAIAPSEPSTLYLGTNAVGNPGTQLAVSHDGGSTFQPLPGPNDPVQPIISIDLLAVDPTDANTLYVAATVQLAYPPPAGPRSIGTVFKSQDAGQTFASLPIEVAGAAVTALLIDPIHPAVLYGATGTSFYSPDSEVLVSPNAGGGWSNLAPGLPGLPVVQLALGPAGILYAGTQGAGAYKLALAGN